MVAQRFDDQFNTQIDNEFSAHQQYIACTTPRAAGV